jgi:hypothetical protein
MGRQLNDKPKRPRGRPRLPPEKHIAFARLSVSVEAGIKEAFEAWCAARGTTPNRELAYFVRRRLAE